MLTKYVLSLCLLLLTAFSPFSVASESDTGTPQWVQTTPGGTVVTLWFFWSEKCPHCRDAHPHISELSQQLPWLKLESYRLDGHPENVAIYRWMASTIGQEARSVPAFIFCGQMQVGWDDQGVVRSRLLEALEKCRAGEKAPQPLLSSLPNLPGLGEVDLDEWSIAAFTIVIAGLDSFNPCAFFVLLFLLSLLVHAGSRRRMFIIGSFFILVSGLVYFASMVAWLNLFGFIGHMTIVTTVAGAIAIAIAGINIKDYFRFREGISLSISDENRGKLMQRMRKMLSASSLPTMLAATFTLAVIANLYELLCTAGFPMVYTRYLTLNELPTAEYYLYILLYNLVYILPLLLIMLIFVVTFGQRKLRENEGRVLKLLSGLMMLALGFVLVIDPGLLNQVGVAVSLLLGVIATTLLIVKIAPAR